MKKWFFLAFVSAAVFTGSAQSFSHQALVPINSIFDDQNPVLSPDGKTLYLTIANHPQNVAGKKDLGDIWVSTWTADGWSIPVHGDAALNDRNYNAVAGISPDGNQLFLFNHYDASGSPVKTQGISISRKIGNSWSFPEKIFIPYFLNKSLSISGQVSQNGSVLLYSAEAFDTKGEEDLYVTLKNNDGQWSEPQNLGLVINTYLQELTPALSADTRYIYFSSNGRKGYGSFDVYFSERLDNTWKNWSVPVNMGSRVNTDSRELYYHTFPKFDLALFTSTQNSDGYGDVRFFMDSTKVPVADTSVKITEIRRTTPLSSSDKRATISGTVTNSKTGQPVVARLNFRSDSTYQSISGRQGTYSLRIPSTQMYSIVVEAAGYVGVLEKLDIHTFEMQQVELNFRLQPIEIGATVNLKNVLFQVGTTTLLNESYDELDVVIDLLTSNPKIEIELAGHTDNRGDAKLNLKLSQNRVEKIKEYLVKQGISGKRVHGKGYGGKRPITNSESEESRRLNRRVEFTIVKD
jgi:OmpA-OmpF porin, OOP family